MVGVQQVAAALQGDKSAAMQLARGMLRDQREQLKEVRAVIENKRGDEWDEQRIRQMCLDGEISEDVSEQAYHAVHDQIISITHKAPLALLSDGEEAEVYKAELKDDLFELAVLLANPTIKYGLIALVEPENREVVAENLHYTANEIWTTAWVLTDPGEISWSDFPPDTETAIRAVLDEQEQQANRRENQGGQADD